MKRAFLILAIAAALVLAFSASAFANFGPHGGYDLDTDACAGCHRAHTSFSDVTWSDGQEDHSALLVSDANTMEEFCYACHGDDAPGASTNVQSGIFDGGPSGAAGAALDSSNKGVAVAYETNSSYDATLNGGGFDSVPVGADENGVMQYAPVTSKHNMQLGTGTEPMWGFGNAVTDSGVQQAGALGGNFTCVECHDPHGSSNYRLLKDSLPGGQVGHYDGDVPAPFVISNEDGYPTGGWRKHSDGAADMKDYRPNYTTAEYGTTGDMSQGISGWCAGCHTQYLEKKSDYNYGGYEAVDANRTAGTLNAGSGAAVGNDTRHRHPMNVSLAGGTGVLTVNPVVSDKLPLEMNTTAAHNAQDTSGLLGCLTCHRAHGTQVTMSGWAQAKLVQKTDGSWSVQRLALAAGSNGVNPNFSTALLRVPNRGVCERCHNK